MKPPKCGLKDSSKAIHEKQIKSSSGIVKDLIEDLKYYYKCSNCCNSDKDNIGRSRVKNDNVSFGEKQLNEISKITRLPLEQTHIACPWTSYENPLWIEVMKLINKVEAGVHVDFSSVDNIVVEAFVFYRNCAANVDNYISLKHHESMKAQRSKSTKRE